MIHTHTHLAPQDPPDACMGAEPSSAHNSCWQGRSAQLCPFMGGPAKHTPVSMGAKPGSAHTNHCRQGCGAQLCPHQMGTEPSSAPTSHQAWALSPAPPQQNKVSTSVGTEPSSAQNSKTNPWQVGLQCVRQSQLASVCSECVWLRALLVTTRLQHVAACTGMFPTPRLRPRLQARLCPAPSLPLRLPPVTSTLSDSCGCR